jgi:flagellar FliJ protein
MASFQFRLATLLRLRANVRDERRAQLAEAQRAEQLVVERIAAIDAELIALRAQSLNTAQAKGALNVDGLSEIARYEMILKVERQSADQQRQTVAAEVQKRRDLLIIADRDVRILEKLRDVQLDRYQEQEARREMQRLDELAVLRYERRETP